MPIAPSRTPPIALALTRSSAPLLASTLLLAAAGCATWPEVAVAHPVLVVAVGSCEQHGPHLPLGTDSVIAAAVAERLVAGLEAADRPAVLAPIISIGASGEHAGFPGTLSFGSAVMEEMVVELVRSADHFGAVVIVNGHGGNTAALAAAGECLAAEGRRLVVIPCAFNRGDAHAGRTETSVMLALAPDLVRIDLAEPGAVEGWPALRDRVLAGGVASVSPNGVLGDPTGATAAEGRGLLDDLVARSLATVLKALDALVAPADPVDPVDPVDPADPVDPPARLHG